jgi:hypothetical protein
MTPVVINQKFRAVAPAAAGVASEQAVKVAEMFGVGLDETYEVALYDGLALDVRPGDVVFVTGPSGSGKSVLLARLAEALGRTWADARTVDLAQVDLPRDRAVIDLMQPPLQDALRILSAAGLADAFLLLRTPQELSDGQRYRLRLARAIEALLAPAAPPMCHGLLATRGHRHGLQASRGTRAATPSALLVADEFCSTLDRLCARAVAYRVRRMADEHGVTVLAASAHNDLLEDLSPDVLVVKHEAARVEVIYRDPSREVQP